MASKRLKTVTSCSKLCINITHLNESEALITVMSEFFFSEGFSLGHVNITTIIKSVMIINTQNLPETVKDISFGADS